MPYPENKERGRNTGVYFYLQDLEILAALGKHYGDALDRSAIMRLALRALVKAEGIKLTKKTLEVA
jgi:hypothetical protein